MAASAIEPEHNRMAAGTGTKQHRRRLLSHLIIQVPVPGSSGWSGRPSGPASAPPGAAGVAHHHQHQQQQERPASPSLLRSPTAWIRSKGHGFGSGNKHTPRRPSGGGNFHYDARSYAQNFDDGGGREEDALRQHVYSSAPSLLASPSSLQGVVSGGGSNGGDGDGEEPARETFPVVQ